jgi:geranylgeranyl pyrophosphate synthase
MGALAGGAKPDLAARFRELGRLLGLAFQITDDLLDDSAATGKSPGKDKAAGKLTYLALMDRDEAQAAATATTTRALAQLDGTGLDATLLIQLAHGLLARDR